MKRRDRGPQVAHRTRCTGILQQTAEHVSALELGEGIADDEIPSQRLGAGAQHGQSLRMYVGIDEE